jgi:four helix bundle protein
VEKASFRELAVYQRAAQLADEVRLSVRTWESTDLWTADIQTIRAADSIGANIAEALGRWSRADQARFLVIARGSVNELEHWLFRAAERSLPLPANAAGRAGEIGRMLNGLMRSLPRR